MVEDFKDDSGRWAKSVVIAGKKHLTKSYSVWNGIRNRCKPGGKFQQRFPSYVGCTMSPLFADFQSFTDWHVRQVGYGLAGYELDKDLLDKGRKLYSETTCLLLPKDLNSFHTPNVSRKSTLPQGVYFTRNRYKAAISIDSVVAHIGYYDTQELASEAFKKAKKQEALRWVARLEAKEFVVDSRAIEALKSFEVLGAE